MKRAENCVDAKINHIRFENDCLVFEFAKSKSLPDGGIMWDLGMFMLTHMNLTCVQY